VPDGLLLTVGFSSSASGPSGAPNRLLKLGLSGALAELFNLDRFEQERDPDGRGPGSNATGIAVAPDGSLWVTDAGGNWAARLTASGTLQTMVTFSDTQGEEAVPTGVAIGPDGNAYVALFRCLTPTTGKGGVARVRPDGGYDLVASGLSMPIDVAFDPSGALYVLEFAVDYAPDSGRLLRLAANGSPEALADGLRYPTSLAIDSSGRIYVTQMDAVAGGPPASGKLIRFDP
jgi:sugar lactone lactonase YvrE